jgi:hypothetical protein
MELFNNLKNFSNVYLHSPGLLEQMNMFIDAREIFLRLRQRTKGGEARQKPLK